jgi:hypothetical protein
MNNMPLETNSSSKFLPSASTWWLRNFLCLEQYYGSIYYVSFGVGLRNIWEFQVNFVAVSQLRRPVAACFKSHYSLLRVVGFVVEICTVQSVLRALRGFHLAVVTPSMPYTHLSAGADKVGTF